ncbi:MAG: saccharopine dehydrogenase-like oxidoreductase [Candidatus Sumerlaeia bacterium]|nr:saccharopine dehydrogenase-like oxidoreductase [Candidatus Sumerlaeia bacterium]
MSIKQIGILGAGGLGRSAVALLEQKTEFKLVAIADSEGIATRESGINTADLNGLELGTSVKQIAKIGRVCTDSVADMVALNKAGKLDAVFLAIPNIPNTYLPSVIERFCDLGFKGVLVDAMKRTSAVEQVLKLSDKIRAAGIAYVTGAGATPGLLTAAANLAAQSFAEIHDVKIWFGVGIANWETYRATVREDIAHMPGYNVDKVKLLSDKDIERILDECNGVLELHGMEHADDILLERAGVVQREKVNVGGLVDTRRAVKPTQTMMTLRGTTFEGKTAEHTFTLGNETSMAANVLGPAFGWMKAALEMQDRGIVGLFSSADLMPKYVK